VPYFEIRVDMSEHVVRRDLYEKHSDSLAIRLAGSILKDKTPREISQMLDAARNRGDRYFLLARDVSYSDVKLLRTFPIFRAGRFRGGLIVERQNKRHQPYNMLAHRTIGYVREGAHPVGLEGRFDSFLTGESGWQLMQRRPGNIWVPVDDIQKIAPEPGADVITTIDLEVQTAVHSSLLNGLKRHDADYGCVVCMEVKTGAIAGISNIAKTATGYWETYNYAVGESVEHGSTFKLATVMALLEGGYVKADDDVALMRGQMQFFDQTMEDSRDHQKEVASLKDAFAMSSNVGIASLVHNHFQQTNRPQKFIDGIRQLGVGMMSGIEIDGEGRPYIKDPSKAEDQWSGITLPWMAIGYEVSLTPLQMLMLYNAVANNGAMMKPYLVSEIKQYGTVIKKYEPTVLKRRIASTNTIQTARDLLRSVVQYGTASNINSTHYTLSGKTGTAQVYDVTEDGRPVYRASFVGYFPSHDPVYSCIVMIYNPKKNGFYGGTVAAPVFKEIADKIWLHHSREQVVLNNLPIAIAANKMPGFDAGARSDFHSILKSIDFPYMENTDSDWTVARPSDKALELLTRSIRPSEVPNVVGMGFRDALYLLEKEGLKVNANGIGRVSAQSVSPGEKATGQIVALKLE